MLEEIRRESVGFFYAGTDVFVQKFEFTSRMNSEFFVDAGSMSLNGSFGKLKAFCNRPICQSD